MVCMGKRINWGGGENSEAALAIVQDFCSCKIKHWQCKILALISVALVKFSSWSMKLWQKRCSRKGFLLSESLEGSQQFTLSHFLDKLHQLFVCGFWANRLPHLFQIIQSKIHQWAEVQHSGLVQRVSLILTAQRGLSPITTNALPADHLWWILYVHSKRFKVQVSRFIESLGFIQFKKLVCVFTNQIPGTTFIRQFNCWEGYYWL